MHASAARPGSREAREDRRGKDAEVELEPDAGVVVYTKIKEAEQIDGEEDIMEFINQKQKKKATPELKPGVPASDGMQKGEKLLTLEPSPSTEEEIKPDVQPEAKSRTYSLSQQDPEYVPMKLSSTIRFQQKLNAQKLESRPRTWRLRQKYRPISLKFLNLPEGYEVLEGDHYTVRAYSHCNGFTNENIEYLGTRPHRCCPTLGFPRHLYDMSIMLLEKCPVKTEKKNLLENGLFLNINGSWTLNQKI